MVTVDTRLLDDVVTLVRTAGDVTSQWFRHDDLAVERKGDGTPVTAADKAAERFLREELGRRFPDDAIIGEEEASSAGTSGCTWVIDPIDGTKAFTHGVPLYSNLVARYDPQGCAIGVINLPALDETVYAGRGLGCFVASGPEHEPQPARVNHTAELDESCVCTSGLGGWAPGQLDALHAAGLLVRTWGDGFGFALVATGRIEAMVDPKLATWDLGPLPVIIREAGGRYTELDGNENVVLDPDRVASAVATNGAVHDQLLDVLRGS